MQKRPVGMKTKFNMFEKFKAEKIIFITIFCEVWD